MESLYDNELILSVATLMVAFGTIATVGIYYKFFKKQNEHLEKQNEIAKRNVNFNAMLQIMKIFNDTENARNRDLVYMYYRAPKTSGIFQLYDEQNRINPVGVGTDPNGMSITLQHVVASVRGSFDQMGKLMKEGYVRPLEFLEMYSDPVMRMWQVLKRHILQERIDRDNENFMVYFEMIFNESKIYWKLNNGDKPIPKPF